MSILREMTRLRFIGGNTVHSVEIDSTDSEFCTEDIRTLLDFFTKDGYAPVAMLVSPEIQEILGEWSKESYSPVQGYLTDPISDYFGDYVYDSKRASLWVRDKMPADYFWVFVLKCANFDSAFIKDLSRNALERIKKIVEV